MFYVENLYGLKKQLILVLTILVFNLFNLPAQAQEKVKPRIKVITTKINFTANDRVFEAVGTGRAQFSADIHSAISEEVTDILFESQQRVNKGDVLVQMDNRHELLAVRLAKVKLKNTRSLLNRYKKAVKNGAVPQSEVDEAQANYDSANLELERALLSLEERQVIAPFDGVVGIPNVDPGDRLNPDTLITGLDNRDILYIDFEVPESLAGALKKAQEEKQEIKAITPSYSGNTFKGTITAQESRLNPATRTIMARASIVNDEDLLRPGMSFKTRWEIPGKKYATVPEISLQWGRDGSFIWIIQNGIAKKTTAQVVARIAGRVLLEGDIKEGDEVVLEGVQRLRPDSKVEIIGRQ